MTQALTGSEGRHPGRFGRRSGFFTAPGSVGLIARIAAGVLAGALMQGAAAQAEPVFTPEATERCVAEAYTASPSQSSHVVLDCVGRSAQACITSPGGDTTIGMMACLDRERQYWDGRLNAAYAKRMRSAKQSDQTRR